MSQLDKTTFEGTFNDSSTGLFKNNTTKAITAERARTLVTHTKDSVPFTVDDSYTWPFPQVTASGTDTYTATLSPAITAYVVGQKFQLLFTNANTGPATAALNGLSALAITKNGTTALSAGDIPAGSIKLLAYDGTRLQIVGDGGGGGGASAAEDVTFTPAGNIAATDVQAAIQELDTEKASTGSVTTVATDLSNHIADATDAHDASAISFSATGGISSTDVQAAIAEVDTEKVSKANTASALTDGASIDITGPKHTLTTDEATITFSISHTGDFSNIDVTFNTTAATWTFPAGSLCVVEGSESGDNTATIAATSGDKIVISTWFVAASTYRIVIKNFGQ